MRTHWKWGHSNRLQPSSVKATAETNFESISSSERDQDSSELYQYETKSAATSRSASPRIESEAEISAASAHVSAGERLALGVADIVITVALFGELVVVLVNVIARAAGVSTSWADELTPLALSIITFIGAAAAALKNEHLSLHILDHRLRRDVRRAFMTCGDCAIVVIAAVTVVLGIHFAVAEWSNHTPVLQFSYGLYDLPLPIGAALIGFASLMRVWRAPRRTAAAAGSIVIAITILIWYATAYSGQHLTVGGSWGCMLAVFVVLVLLGVPIAFAFIATSMLGLLLPATAPLNALVLQMRYEVSNFILIAVPFFLLAGALMTESGLSKRIADVAHVWLGHFRGGMYQVVVVTMFLFSGLAGVKVADIAAVGSTLTDIMDRQGHPRARTAAVLAASAAMGETIPPSVVLLIAGSLSSVSVGTLFVAGLLPAAALAACLMILIYVQARFFLPDLRMPKVPFRERTSTTVKSLPAVGLPVVLVGGIVTGIGTPSEVSSFAVMYGIITAILVYRSARAKQLFRIAVDAARMSGVILFLVSAASTLGWVLADEGIDSRVSSLAAQLGDSPGTFMAITICFFIVVGCVLEGAPAIVLFLPILFPIAVKLGINPLQYDVVVIIAQGVGTFLPPLGIGVYVTASICKVRVQDTFRPIFGYLSAIVVGLILIATFAGITTALPNFLNIH